MSSSDVTLVGYMQDDALARERTDIDRHIEYGIGARTVLARRFLGHRGRDGRFDEGAAHYQNHHNRHDKPAQGRVGQAAEQGVLSILHQPATLQEGGKNGQAQIAQREQGEGQKEGFAETYLVGVGTSEKRQQIKGSRENTRNHTGFEIVEAKRVREVERDDNEDGIVGHALKHLNGVAHPKGAGVGIAFCRHGNWGCFVMG